jgi:hypothetical protein
MHGLRLHVAAEGVQATRSRHACMLKGADVANGIKGSGRGGGGGAERGLKLMDDRGNHLRGWGGVGRQGE